MRRTNTKNDTYFLSLGVRLRFSRGQAVISLDSCQPFLSELLAFSPWAASKISMYM